MAQTKEATIQEQAKAYWGKLIADYSAAHPNLSKAQVSTAVAKENPKAFKLFMQSTQGTIVGSIGAGIAADRINEQNSQPKH